MTVRYQTSFIERPACSASKNGSKLISNPKLNWNFMTVRFQSSFGHFHGKGCTLEINETLI